MTDLLTGSDDGTGNGSGGLPKSGSKNTNKTKATSKEPIRKIVPVLRNLQVTDKSQYELPTTLPRRPDFNDTGDNCTVAINSYPVLEYPTKTVFQYDVSTLFHLALYSFVRNNY